MGNIILPMWAECPALTRSVIVGYPVISLAMMLLQLTPIGGVGVWLFDTTLFSVLQCHIWALFIGCFYTPMLAGGMQFLMALITIYMVMMYFPRREREMGSTAHLLWIMWINFLVNALRLLVMVALVYVFKQQQYMFFPSGGMWPILIVDLTINMLADPEGSTSFWGMVTIPNKWYPIALVAIFCLLSGMRPLWDMIAAVAFGYAHAHFALERFMPTAARAARFERLGCCKQGRFSLLGASWVPAGSTPGFGDDPSDRRYAGLSDFGRTSGGCRDEGGGGGGGFTAFSGQGNTLGSGDAPRAPPRAPSPAPQKDEETGEAPPKTIGGAD